MQYVLISISCERLSKGRPNKAFVIIYVVLGHTPPRISDFGLPPDILLFLEVLC